MDIGQAIFNFIATPDVAYVLLILGLFSLVVAVGAPGTGLAEVASVLCLLLSFLGLSRLPVNFAGIVLIMAGIGLFIVDLKVQSALLAIGGAVVMAIGSLFLFQPREEAIRVSLWLIALATLGAVVFFGFGLQKARKALHQRVRMDVTTLVGAHGVIRAALTTANDLTGTAQIAGELWTVKSDRPMDTGAKIIVLRVEGLSLFVSPDLS